ncbi:hypothetical protein lbkm_3440 [Lachnospiraceae bacterium KM106-2]|nr:hypothetical protein lbkm_3440 [Lachnospiraceae bacterium KM106-2]
MIGILPDFIGYYFLVSGFRRMERESEHFKCAKPVAVLMGIYMTVSYVANLFAGKTLNEMYEVLIVNVFTLAGLLYILYEVVKGVEELQEKHEIGLKITVMKWQWRIIAIGKVVILVLTALEMLVQHSEKEMSLIYSPLSGGMSIVFYIIIAMINIVSLWFIIEFSQRDKQMYRE